METKTTMPDRQHLDATMAETYRRYPHAADALVFFGVASGLFPGEVTLEDVALAQEVIKRHGRL